MTTEEMRSSLMYLQNNNENNNIDGSLNMNNNVNMMQNNWEEFISPNRNLYQMQDYVDTMYNLNVISPNEEEHFSPKVKTQ